MTLDHPIFTRWPAQYPDRLQLFSAPTPNGVKVGERFGQVARELCLRLLVVFDRLASIEPGAPDIFQVFLYRALEVARPQACSRYAVRQSHPRTRDRCPGRRSRASTTPFTRTPTRSRSSRRWTRAEEQCRGEGVKLVVSRHLVSCDNLRGRLRGAPVSPQRREGLRGARSGPLHSLANALWHKRHRRAFPCRGALLRSGGPTFSALRHGGRAAARLRL